MKAHNQTEKVEAIEMMMEKGTPMAEGEIKRISKAEVPKAHLP